jgi:hypothetical protein
MALPEGAYPVLVAKLKAVGVTTLAQAQAALHTRNIPNPVATPKITPLLDLTELASRVPVAIKAPLIRHAALVNAVRENDRPAAAEALQAMVVAKELTAAQRTAIIAWAQQTVDDPDWPLQLSWCESQFGRQLEDVELKTGLQKAQA